MKLNAKTLSILTAGALACGQVAAKPPELTVRGDAMDARVAAPVSSPNGARSVEFPLDLWNVESPTGVRSMEAPVGLWNVESPAGGGRDPRVTTEKPQTDVGAGTFWIKQPERTIR